MAYTLAVRIAAHQSLLDLLSTGTGTAGLKLLAGATELATLPIDHTTSEVSVVDGTLTLEPVAGGATAVASGTCTSAQLLDRDGGILDDSIAVEAGSAPVAGKVVLSSLSLIVGGQVDLISCVVG